MFLFGKKPTKPQLKEYTFTLSKGFRGYKRFPISIHGHKESEKNNKVLKDTDLREHKLTFKPASSSTTASFYQVFIDGLQVGSIFDKDQINSINYGRIEAVFARSEKEAVMGPKKIIERPVMRLFVKYKES